MLHLFFGERDDLFQAFNLVNYITFRTGGALMTALLIVFLFGPAFIRWVKGRQGAGQPIRDDGPSRHVVEKAGTPTMGGALILAAVVAAVVLWADLSNVYVWAVLMVTAGYGLLGFIDDYRKVTKRSSKGLSGRAKLAAQFAIAFAAVYWMTAAGEAGGRDGLSTALALPFLKDTLLQLGPFFFLFAGIVIVGSSNAVNLTDGLDGLAVVPVMFAAMAFGVIAYLAGNAVFADYLQIHYVAGAGELAILCGALIGAGLGFLWYNAPPAAIFMGDTGSLALGGALGATAVAAKHELVLAIVGGLFVVEALSVMIQVASFKLTGKRVFRMAPIHHHFEQLGWREPTIVIRFWIISFVLALAGLATLKIR